jgi:hypothetical protein
MPPWGGNEKLPIYNGAQEEHQRRVTPRSTRPNWSSGKCAPAPVVRSSSSSRHRRSLVRPAKAGSTSPSECQAGSSSWTGQVMASPRSRARCAPEASTTHRWPGVCPGVSTVVTPGAIAVSRSSGRNRSASAAARQPRARTGHQVRPEVLRPAHKRPVRDRVDAQVSDQHLTSLPSFGWLKPVIHDLDRSKTPRGDGCGRPALVPEPSAQKLPIGYGWAPD